MIFGNIFGSLCGTCNCNVSDKEEEQINPSTNRAKMDMIEVRVENVRLRCDNIDKDVEKINTIQRDDYKDLIKIIRDEVKEVKADMMSILNLLKTYN